MRRLLAILLSSCLMLASVRRPSEAHGQCPLPGAPVQALMFNENALSVMPSWFMRGAHERSLFAVRSSAALLLMSGLLMSAQTGGAAGVGEWSTWELIGLFIAGAGLTIALRWGLPALRRYSFRGTTPGPRSRPSVSSQGLHGPSERVFPEEHGPRTFWLKPRNTGGVRPQAQPPAQTMRPVDIPAEFQPTIVELLRVVSQSDGQLQVHDIQFLREFRWEQVRVELALDGKSFEILLTRTPKAVPEQGFNYGVGIKGEEFAEYLVGAETLPSTVASALQEITKNVLTASPTRLGSLLRPQLLKHTGPTQTAMLMLFVIAGMLRALGPGANEDQTRIWDLVIGKALQDILLFIAIPIATLIGIVLMVYFADAASISPTTTPRDLDASS